MQGEDKDIDVVIDRMDIVVQELSPMESRFF